MPPIHAATPDSLEWLRLEELDRDLYRGFNEKTLVPDRPNLYGGQVMAQALRAAAHTVPEGRLPHSLHGYFLRPGDPHQPIIFRVDRDRDGRSFSARRVAATQNADVIFEMSASFHETEPSPEYTEPMRQFAPPEECSAFAFFTDLHACLEVRLPVAAPFQDSFEGINLDQLWARITAPVPDAAIDHMCLLTFMSDLGGGFSGLALEGISPYGPSIDHAVWFQAPIRADQWILFDMRAVKIGGNRGVYIGAAHDQSGTLGAIFTQEVLLRSTTPPASHI
jgi:acyl-CoA thioesterase-2